MGPLRCLRVTAWAERLSRLPPDSTVARPCSASADRLPTLRLNQGAWVCFSPVLLSGSRYRSSAALSTTVLRVGLGCVLVGEGMHRPPWLLKLQRGGRLAGWGGMAGGEGACNTGRQQVCGKSWMPLMEPGLGAT